MLKVPKITILMNREADTNQFISFMNNSRHSGKKALILRAYPEVMETTEAIRATISRIYEEKSTELKEAFNAAKEQLEKSSEMLSVLAEIMDYPQLGEKEYTAVPTVLPFSPFGGSTFYFSVYSSIFKTKNDTLKPVSVVPIAVHEISHFIFFDQLREWEMESGKKLIHPAGHYFKEALTAAIMDGPKFKEIFDYQTLRGEKRYRGNPELHDFSIKYDGDKTNIVDFFKIQMFGKGGSYKENLFRLLGLFARHQDKFKTKWDTWNTHLSHLENPELYQDYPNPLELD